jgi:hypothetical protein
MKTDKKYILLDVSELDSRIQELDERIKSGNITNVSKEFIIANEFEALRHSGESVEIEDLYKVFGTNLGSMMRDKSIEFMLKTLKEKYKLVKPIKK